MNKIAVFLKLLGVLCKVVHEVIVEPRLPEMTHNYGAEHIHL